MVTQTPNEPHVGQPHIKQAALSSHSASDSTATPHGAQAPSSTQRTAQPFSTTTAVLAGAALVGAIALFGIGLARTHIRPTLRRLVKRARNIQAPVLFPVTIAEFARELLADRSETP